MSARAVFAIVTWCGKGSIRVFSNETEARETFALMGLIKCCSSCTREHRVVKLGEDLR
jgi:hypothetical protein